MKKRIFVLATIVLVLIISTVCLFYFNNKNNVQSEINQSDVNQNLDENIKSTDDAIKNSEIKDIDDNQKEETTTNEIDISKENNDENISNNSSNKNSSNNTTNNNTNNKNNSTTVTDKNNSQNIEQKTEEVKPKSCTPKKFDMSFVRADFNSMAKCTETGDKYKALGYGYFCDFYQDDCGDTYYMLTLYERNTGVEFDFHNIELPN